MNKKVYWLWLSLAVTPGAVTFAKLLEVSSDPEVIYGLDKDELVSIIGSRSRDLLALSDKRLDRAEEILDFCTSRGVGILLYSDPEFPKALRDISNPPVLLYYRGVLPDFEKLFCVSVVGMRRLSDYGRRNAFSIAYDLSRAGATVVSGMAIGIDGVAHAAALSAGGITVAFMGSGIDVCYPSQHKRLAQEIVKTGCVFTEYPPGTRPEKYNFPQRNRLISGISEATLVIEGKERSGALLTARCAKDQGKSLYALPGNVGNVTSELSNLLIKNGASLITGADDIVRDFEEAAQGKLNPFALSKRESVDMMSVISALEVSAVSADDAIFKPSRKRRADVAPERRETETVIYEPREERSEREPSFDGLDETAIKIYRKIPIGEGCNIESLIDDELSLRVIMKGLLKLEMGRFVTMLPGERVRRNF